MKVFFRSRLDSASFVGRLCVDSFRKKVSFIRFEKFETLDELFCGEMLRRGAPEYFALGARIASLGARRFAADGAGGFESKKFNGRPAFDREWSEGEGSSSVEGSDSVEGSSSVK